MSGVKPPWGREANVRREGVGGRAAAPEARTLSLASLGGHPKIKDVIYQELRERIVFGGFSP